MNLKIKNLSKKYNQKKIFENISFELEPNKIYGLLGLNGVGKTTLVKSIFNEIEIDSGEILINNKKISFENYRDMYFFSENNDFPRNLIINDLINIIVDLYNVDKEHLKVVTLKFQSLLKEINFKKIKISNLSSGQTKLISLMLCSLVKPKIIFLDEPTANLDLENKNFVLKCIKSLKSDETIVVVATHLIEEIEDILDNIIILDKGTIKYNDKVDKTVKIKDLFKATVKIKDIFSEVGGI